MAYFIEFGQSPDEAFYQEFVIIDQNTGALVPGNGIDHRLNVYGHRFDYCIPGLYGSTIASNANGLITSPQTGVLAVTVPPSIFFGVTDIDTGVWTGGFETRRQSLRFKLLAVPADPDLTKTLVTGTISFGDRLMSSPRIRLSVYPLYPAPAVPTVQVTQAKEQLAKVSNQYDVVEAGLPTSTLDPARIAWDTGGPMTLGGPLSNSIANSLGFDLVAMSIFLTAAAANPL